jgi:ABC-type transport system involved in multi-copper enzyme maturation permease subunit
MTDSAAASPLWAMRRTQLLAVLRIELKKTLFGRRAIPMYLLAALPIPLFAIMAAVPVEAWREHGIGQASRIYGVVYQTFMLRAVIFFGCVGLFTSLFRGEMLDRSLHYYFLAPVRREVLVVGKYLSGLLTTSIVFAAMVLATYLLLYVPFGATAALEYLVRGPGLGHLAAYLGVTLLACLGYGSVFLILGLIFRNPILPGAVVLFWELIHFLLPPALKRISVIHYLKGLLPMPMSEGPFAVLSDPPSVWASVAGLLLFSVVVLTLSAWRIRRMEISYAD